MSKGRKGFGGEIFKHFSLEEVLACFQTFDTNYAGTNCILEVLSDLKVNSWTKFINSKVENSNSKST